MSSQENDNPKIASHTEEPATCSISPGTSANSPQESTPTPAITTPRKNRKNRKGQFAGGTSGNPAGRPPGSRNKTTLLMEALLEGQAEQLMQKAIDMALAGDAHAMKLVMDRLHPARKDRPIHLTLPRVETLPQISLAFSRAVEAMADGHITPNEGEALANIFAMQANVLANADLDRRVTELEQGASASKDKQAA